MTRRGSRLKFALNIIARSKIIKYKVVHLTAIVAMA